MMKYRVFKTAAGTWRFSALDGIQIAGDCDTWAEAYTEAYDLACIGSVGAA